MRELKFRAWEKSLKQMIPVYSIDFETKVINTESAWRMFNEIELMQYIELKDKNDIEIYEGDICLVTLKFFDIKNNISVVAFKDGCFSFQYGCTKDYIKTFNAWDTDTIEVIGNIYENIKKIPKKWENNWK